MHCNLSPGRLPRAPGHSAEEVATAAAGKLAETGVLFVQEFDPQSGGIEGDTAYLQAAFLNILKNTIDACLAEGGPKERKSPGPSADHHERVRHYSHAQDGLWSRNLCLPHTVDRRKFMEAVASLAPSVFRVKGIVAFLDSQQTMLFQYVGGRWELSVFRDSDVHDRFLTVIGRGDLDAGIGPLEALAAKAHIRKHPDRRQ